MIRRAIVEPRWLVHLGAWLALAAAVHLLAVWGLPRLIMQRVLAGVRAEAPAAGGALLPPLTDHTQRRVVMPSPDLLYALCALDLRTGPWRIRADAARPGAHGYWSVALYAANTDNFFVIGDRELQSGPLDLRVLGPDAAAGSDAATAATAGTERTDRINRTDRTEQSVRAPSARVLVLMRVLVGDATRDLAGAEAARRTLRCERAG
jgi:uncharacterized membrane protein